jgi:cytochrome P450
MEKAGPKWFAETFTTWAELFDPSTPQTDYVEAFSNGEPIRPKDGMLVMGTRAGADQVLRHPDLYSARDVVELGNVRPLIPISIEPPEHAGYRSILEPLFAPKRMEAMEPDMTAWANTLIDSFVDRGSCDFTAEFGLPYPSAVFLGIMGLPVEDLDHFVRLKDGIMHPTPDDPSDFDEFARIQAEAGQEVYRYFDAALRERIASPREDTLSLLLAASVDGRAITRDEVLDICFNLMLAGLDTLTAGLTTCMAFLAQSEEHQQQLIDDPKLVPDAVEELLRWESPVAGVFRRAEVDSQINGCPVREGDFVHVAIGAANLDPTEFSDPMTVDFRRSPNRHLAFGKGIHRCLGSHLARREIRVALREWHHRIPRYRVQDGVHLEYVIPTRGVTNLKLVWDAAFRPSSAGPSSL